MQRTRAARLWLLIASAALAACGGGSNSGSPSANDAGARASGGNGATGGATGSNGAGRNGSGGSASGGGQSPSSAGRNAGTGGRSASGGERSASGGGNAAGASGGSPIAGANGASGAAGSSATHAVLYVSGYGPDISVFDFDETSGAAKKQSSVQGPTAPSYLALAPDKKHLYAIDENNGGASKVFAFTVAADDGHLSAINSAASGGDGAPHLSVHPNGMFVAVAHYSSGHTSILPVMANGGVAAPSDVKQGPNNGCKNAHEAVFDASGRYLFVPCLGSNYVIQYVFMNGTLAYNDPATVAVSGGPRHFAFDPEQKHAYVLSENDSILTSFDYDASAGKLTNPQSVNSYQNQKGSSAHVEVHPSGKWLYASNRGENTIGAFSLDANGRPSKGSFVHDMLATPRDFTIDPRGAFLIAANQAGAQNLLLYAIDASDGALAWKQAIAVGGSPTCVKVVELP